MPDTKHSPTRRRGDPVDQPSVDDAQRSSRWGRAIVALLVAAPLVGWLVWAVIGSAPAALALAGVVNLAALGFFVGDRRRQAADRAHEATRREATKVRELETKAIFETAPDGIVTVDAEGTLHSANRAASRIFNLTRDELVGAQLRDLVPSIADAERSSGDNTTSILMTRGAQHTGRRANGTEFPLEVNMAFLPRHVGEAGMVLIFRDVTKRKEVEQELRDTRDRALAASEAKSRFLAKMSHELRTPLNGVIGYAEMIGEEIEFAHRDGRPVDAIDFVSDVERIGASGRHLLALVDDILALSKIESGRMQTDLSDFDVLELLDGIADVIEPAALENGNELWLETGAELGRMHSDATKVRQILFNLLSNACKFTHDGRVELCARRHASPHGDELVFEVRDTGIGMTDEQLARVFEAFMQADNSTTREFGGTGLGLTVTRHFCELLGGDIDVESTHGQGTTFTVRLRADLRDATEDVRESKNLLPVTEERVRHES